MQPFRLVPPQSSQIPFAKPGLPVQSACMTRALLLSSALLLAACSQSETAEPARTPAGYGAAMVVAANPLASEAGAEVLRAGGSAVDAAVAVQAVLGAGHRLS